MVMEQKSYKPMNGISLRMNGLLSRAEIRSPQVWVSGQDKVGIRALGLRFCRHIR